MIKIDYIYLIFNKYLMEGELQKWTNYFSQWQNRYCILKGGYFSYLEKHGDPIKSKCSLGISNIIDCENDDLRFDINTGSSVYYLKAFNKEDKEKWVSALRQAKLQADKALLKNDKNEFSFNKTDIQGFPKQIRTLYSNSESIFNLSNQLNKEIISMEKENVQNKNLNDKAQAIHKIALQNVSILNELNSNFFKFTESLKNMMFLIDDETINENSDGKKIYASNSTNYNSNQNNEVKQLVVKENFKSNNVNVNSNSNINVPVVRAKVNLIEHDEKISRINSKLLLIIKVLNQPQMVFMRLKTMMMLS